MKKPVFENTGFLLLIKCFMLTKNLYDIHFKIRKSH